jgi:hypothetical protein
LYWDNFGDLAFSLLNIMPRVRYSAEVRQQHLHFKPMEQYIVVQVLKKSLATCECSAKQSAMAESPSRPIDKDFLRGVETILVLALRR